MDDDLAALTTRTVAVAFCIGSHFDVRALKRSPIISSGGAS
jgi:hypothetical protein